MKILTPAHRAEFTKCWFPQELTLELGWDGEPCGHARQLAVHRYTGQRQRAWVVGLVRKQTMKRLRRDKPGLNCRLEDRDCADRKATCHLFHCCDRSSLREQEFEVAHRVRGNVGHPARMRGKRSHLKSRFMLSVRRHECQCSACVLLCLTGCGAQFR